MTFFDPSNPDNMIGYIQPYFFPTNGNPDSPSPTMSVLNPPGGLFKGTLNVTNHYPAVDFLAQLPPTCQEPLSAPNTPNPNWNGCLGTYHFTIHRQKANVPNN